MTKFYDDNLFELMANAISHFVLFNKTYTLNIACWLCTVYTQNNVWRITFFSFYNCTCHTFLSNQSCLKIF